VVFSSNELDIVILQNGKDGVSADSKYFWVKYSQNPDGSDLTDDPNGAIYIGIAYNKDSIIESEIPSDYSWSKIQGENGTDAYTVILSNENVSFAVDYGTHIATSAQSYSSTSKVLKNDLILQSEKLCLQMELLLVKQKIQLLFLWKIM